MGWMYVDIILEVIYLNLSKDQTLLFLYASTISLPALRRKRKSGFLYSTNTLTMKNFSHTISAILLSVPLTTGGLIAQNFPLVKLQPVTTGLSHPIQVVNAGDGTGRLFVLQKGGAVRVLNRVNDDQYTIAGTFFSTTDLASGSEQGLLSIAFDPDYRNNGRFFVYHTNANGDLVVKRYFVHPDDPNRYDDDPANETTILTIPHPVAINHNGGELHFGPDGYLYLSTGDGGSGSRSVNAQDDNQNLGKILRFDVDGNPAPDNPNPGSHVYAKGLRNPFRWSFDRVTNDVWIGDVGQNDYEEVSTIPFTSLKGANFGWRCYEGMNEYNLSNCPPADGLTFPVSTYVNGDAGESVIGGVVYRGTAQPALYGYYIGGDYYNNQIQIISRVGGEYVTNRSSVGVLGIADFGESENGEVYAVSRSLHTLYRVVVVGALPVRIVHFGAAQEEANSVTLRWGTVNSENFRVYLIEKSKDGYGFTLVDKVPRKDKMGEAQEYVYVDDEIEPGYTYYYRLKIVNEDQTEQYSHIVSVVVKSSIPEASRLVSTNPAEIGILKLNLTDSYEQMELINAFGQRIGHFDLRGKSGKHEIQTGHIPSGMYIARFVGPKKVVTEKVIFP